MVLEGSGLGGASYPQATELAECCKSKTHVITKYSNTILRAITMMHRVKIRPGSSRPDLLRTLNESALVVRILWSRP